MKIIDLEGNCATCGQKTCHCLEEIKAFNAPLEKCKHCNFPIYEGVKHNHKLNLHTERILEGIERRAEQRKKRTLFLGILYISWIAVVILYLIFHFSNELYYLLLFIAVVCIYLVSKLFSVEALDLEAYLEDEI